MKKRISLLLFGALIAFSLTSCGDEAKADEPEKTTLTQPTEQKLSVRFVKDTLTFDYSATKEEVEKAVINNVVTNGTAKFSDYKFSNEINNVPLLIRYNGVDNYYGFKISFDNLSGKKLYLDLKEDSFEFDYGVTKEEIIEEIKKNCSTNGKLFISDYYFKEMKYDEYFYVTIDSSEKAGSISKQVKIKINTEKLNFEISKTSFEFGLNATSDDIKNEISKYITTNGTVTFPEIKTGSISTSVIVITASNAFESKSRNVTVAIKENATNTEALSLTLSKEEFEFESGVTEEAIKNEIAKFVTTNASNIDIENVSASVGEYNATVIGLRGEESVTKTVKVVIKAQASQGEALSLALSKEEFEFESGTTEEAIKNEIAKFVTTNARYIDIENVSTSVGEYNATVIGLRGEETVTKTVKVVIKAQASQGEALSLALSKEEFEFESGTTEEAIKNEIAKFVTTNARYIDIENVSTSVGEYNATVIGLRGEETVTKTVKVVIKAQANQGEVTLSLSKENFEFEFEATETEIKNEILKYVTSNGTISFSAISTGEAGDQTVVVYATIGSKTKTIMVKVTIKEEVIVTLDVSKTSFEFAYGTTTNAMQNTIKEFVTANGMVAIRDLTSEAGTHTVKVDSIIGNKMKTKEITVVVKASGNVALDFKKTSFEFLYGTTKDEMIEEIKNFIITNGTVTIDTLYTYCGTQTVTVKSQYFNSKATKTITVTINPDDSKIKATKLSASYDATNGVTFSITIKNDSGKEVSGFNLDVLCHDGTTVRAFSTINFTFPTQYGSSTTLKNDEENTIRLTQKYNSTFVTFPLDELSGMNGIYTGYDRDFFKTDPQFYWRYYITEVVYKD